MKLFRFLEFPSSLKYSAFSTFYNTEGKRKIPTHFGWLTEPGLYTGMYTYYSSKKTNKVVVIFLPFFEVLHTMVPRTGTILFKKPTNEKKINIILQF